MNILVRLFFTTFSVDKLNNSASMDLIQFLAMKIHQGPVFVDGMVNSTEVVVYSRTNFVKVVQNQLLFRKQLMQLILQDRHMINREIETTLGISGTSIQSILHEHLTVKKICSRKIPHNLSIAQKKKGSCRLVERNYRCASKHVYDILTGDDGMSPKVISS